MIDENAAVIQDGNGLTLLHLLAANPAVTHEKMSKEYLMIDENAAVIQDGNGMTLLHAFACCQPSRHS